jgi:hypothetical protein
MTIVESSPIACTLAPGAFKDRTAQIAALNKDALRNYARRDLVLELSYAPEARGRVREMVRNEQQCCAFLSFQIGEAADEIRLTVTAPEAAREAADTLFKQFIVNASAPSSCACTASFSVATAASKEPPGSKAAGVTALTLSTGALACGVCCVLPFALPATMLASTGALLAWFAKIQMWAKILAVLSVLGAWGWIAWQSRRTRRKPAASTLLMMGAATLVLTVATLWPLLEKPIIRLLRA